MSKAMENRSYQDPSPPIIKEISPEGMAYASRYVQEGRHMIIHEDYLFLSRRASRKLTSWLKTQTSEHRSASFTVDSSHRSQALVGRERERAVSVMHTPSSSTSSSSPLPRLSPDGTNGTTASWRRVTQAGCRFWQHSVSGECTVTTPADCLDCEKEEAEDEEDETTLAFPAAFQFLDDEVPTHSTIELLGATTMTTTTTTADGQRDKETN